MRHVRQKLRLVLRAEGELFGFLFERETRRFHFFVLRLDLPILLGEQRSLLFELLVDLLQFFLLVLEQFFGCAQRSGLRLELGVRPFELFLLLAQLFRLTLQFESEAL